MKTKPLKAKPEVKHEKRLPSIEVIAVKSSLLTSVKVDEPPKPNAYIIEISNLPYDFSEKEITVFLLEHIGHFNSTKIGTSEREEGFTTGLSCYISLKSETELNEVMEILAAATCNGRAIEIQRTNDLPSSQVELHYMSTLVDSRKTSDIGNTSRMIFSSQ